MKISNILFLFLCFCFFLTINAQNKGRLRIVQSADSALMNMPYDAQNALKGLFPDPDKVAWERFTISDVKFSTTSSTSSDVGLERNDVLKYPQKPIINENRIIESAYNQTPYYNLCFVILRLALDNSDYVRSFMTDDQDKIIPTMIEGDKEMLKGSSVWNRIYLATDSAISAKYTYDDLVSASTRCMGFRLRKRYYFESESSEIHSQIVAIAPLYPPTDTTVSRQLQPCFWIKYEDILPWMISFKLQVNPNNTAEIMSFDDYFRKNMYVDNVLAIENPFRKPKLLKDEYADESQAVKSSMSVDQYVDNRISLFKESLTSFSKAIWVNTNAKIQEKMLLQNKKPEKKSKVKKKDAVVEEKKAPEPKKENP